MPSAVQPIPFAPLLETSSEEISGASPEAFNVISDARGVLRKRPGLAAYSVAPSTAVDASGILGLYLTEQRVAHTTGTATVSGTHAGVLYAVGATINASGGGSNQGRNVFRVAAGSATQVGSGAANENRLSTDANATTRTPRPIFAETEALLIIAGGAEIGKIDIRPETFSSPNFTNPNPDYHEMSFLGGCPPLASHVLPNSSRILANDTQLDQTKIRFSDITQGITSTTGHETWDPSPGAAGFVTAEARSDSLVAVAENTNEVWAFGRTSLQLFTPDGSTTFAPTVAVEFGCLAPYSVLKWDNRYVFLDHKTRIVASDGSRKVEVLSGPIQATLDALTTPSDCYAYNYSESFADCLCFRFETDAITLVYQAGIGWSKWALHTAASDAFSQFTVLSHLLRPDGGLNVVGLSDGTIRTLSIDNTTDLGSAIVAYVTTGFLDRDTDEKKQTVAVFLTFKRTPALGDGVTCYLDWRDDLSNAWSTIEVQLDCSDGNQETVVPLPSLGGPYWRRQWRFRFPHQSGLFLVRAREKFNVLES